MILYWALNDYWAYSACTIKLFTAVINYPSLIFIVVCPMVEAQKWSSLIYK
jgi:hypothetical protein